MKLARYIVDHVPTIAVMVLVIFGFGLLSYVTLPREAAPDVKIPVVIVVTPYPGVSPVDVESLVTIPLERKLNEIKDISKLRSMSSEGVSTVTLEFDPDVNIDEALAKVREKVDSAGADLPKDVEDTLVQEISFSDFPILIVTLTGDMDEEALKKLGEDLEDEIEGIPGVLDVKVAGGLTREIRIFADPDRLALYSMTFNDLMFAIQGENVNIPGGTVDAGGSNFMLRVPGQFTEVRQIEDVPVKNVGERTVFVRDVARVVDGYAERATYSRLDGKPSISLSVQKRVGDNIVAVAKATGALVKEESKDWPPGTSYALLSDQSRNVEDMVSELENNIITGLILVVGVLFFFMGFRNSLFVALAIPLSMLISFAVIQFMGLTLNFVVLFSLILALGMLVDNAIVVVENVYRHLEEGYDLKTASVKGVAEVAIPVATSTLTTVLAFAPMLFWSGIMGQFMGYLPKTLIVVLTASLFVAVVVIPAATSALMKFDPSQEGKSDESGVISGDGLAARTMRRYQGVLAWSIDHRYLSIVAGGMTLVGTIVAYAFLNHGTEFFPATEPDVAVVNIRCDEGTRLEETDRITRRVEAVLDQLEDVDNYVTQVGVGGSQFSTSSSPNSAQVTVNFLPGADKAREGETPRAGSTFTAVDRLRNALQTIPGVTITVEKMEMGPPVGAPIAVQISGEGFYQLGTLAEDIRRKMQRVPGVVDITDDYSAGRPELSFSVDRAAAKKVGASTSAVATAVRTAVAGSKASVLRDGDDEYDIVVELAPQFKADLQTVLDLRIPGRDGVSVPISTVARFEPRGGAGAIHRLDTERVVTISANIAEGLNPNQVREAVNDLLSAYPFPEGYAYSMGGADEEQNKAAAFLMKAFLAAVSMIFLVLVTQFNSITLPFIIMASVVLSLIGVLWGLILTGTPFGILMTGIGVISLAGVVVNNAIVLLDYVQVLREQGIPVKEALVRAGTVRFRPVLLTAVTTLLGLLPMATGVSYDFKRLELILGGSSSAFWGPMAVAVIFGLGVATVLTLVMVPTMYSINEDLVGLMGRIRARLRRGSGAEKAAATTALLLALAPALAPGRASAVTLEEAFAAAEANNLDLQILAEQTFQSGTYVGQGAGALGPRVSASATYNVNQYEIAFDNCTYLTKGDEAVEIGGEPIGFCSDPGSGPIVIQQKEAFEYQVVVSQPILNAQSVPGLRAATHLKDAAELSETYARMQVRAGTAKAYYGLVVAHQTVALRRDAVANATERLSLATRQVEVGAAPPMAQLQADLALSRAQRELLQAERDLVRAQEGFATVTGLPGDSQVALPEGARVSVASLSEAQDVAARERPDLGATRKQAEAQAFAARANYATWLPTLDASFVYRWSQNTGFAGQNGMWVAGLAAHWTPWDGGQRIATNRRAASEQRMAELNVRKVNRQVEEEVRLAWERYTQAEQVLSTVQKEVALAEENMRLADEAFAAGALSYIEVQDAQLSLDAAQLGLLLERMNRDLVAVDLAVAMGLYR